MKKYELLNKKARFDYYLHDTFEAGIMLTGFEVKNIRTHNVSITESHIRVENGEAWWVNSTIGHSVVNMFDKHEPTRVRKLLLHKNEIAKLYDAVNKKGNTIVPTKLYENNGVFKLEIAIATGKKTVDKRQTIKEREWKRSGH